MLKGYFSPGEGENFEYDDLQRRKRLAEALMQQGSDYSPVKSWTQGAARLAQALSGSLQREYANKLGQQGQTAYNAKMEEAGLVPKLAAAVAPSTPSGPGPMAAPPTPRPASAGPMPTFAMPGLAEGISVATTKYNLDPSYLPRLAQVESAGGKLLQNPKSSAGGPFGFIDSTGASYGLANKNDAGSSADAAARLAIDNARVLRQRLGRDPNPGELYLAHQQGAGGASALLANPDRPAIEVLTQVYGGNAAKARAALVNNGGDPSMTAGQFASKWINKFGGERLMPQMAQAPATTPDGMPLNPVQSGAPPMAYAGSPAGAAINTAAPQPQPTGNVNAAMYQIMSDPRFSPQQKAQALQMFEMQQKQNMRNPMVIPEGGRAIVPDGRGGYREVATGGPKMTNEQRNFEAARANPDFATYQERMKKAGASSVNVDMQGQKGMQQKGVEAFDAAISAERDATRRIATYGQMAQAMQGFTPGATAEARLAAKAILKDLGFIKGDEVPSAQTFKAIQRRLELAATPKGQGQITENERVLIRETIPSIGNDPQAIARIVQNLDRLDRYDIAVAKIFKDNARKNGGVPNYLEVSEEISRLGPPMTDDEIIALQDMKGAVQQPSPRQQPPAPAMTPEERALEELRRRSRS